MTASVTRDASSATTNGSCQLAVDRVGDEAAEHVHLPVREVEHVHQREDERQPQRDQRILRAEIEAVDDDLFHAPKPVRRAVSMQAAGTGAGSGSPSGAGRVPAQSTLPTNSVLKSPSLYSLTTIGTASWRFWPNEVVPT